MVASVVGAVAVARGPEQPAPVLAVADIGDGEPPIDRSRRGAPPATPPAAEAAPNRVPNQAARPAPKKTAPRPSPAGTTRKPAKTVPKPAPVRAKPTWVSPMPGVRLSSCYGQRWGRMHQGIDLAGPSGTPIRAAGAGRVAAAGWNYPGYGISVVVDHGNGFLTHYAHASRVLVRVGQRVQPGHRLAVEGSTGNSTGPHLHFEVHRGMWHQVNPAPWLRARGVRIGC